MDSDEIKAYIIKLKVCYEAVCQIQKQLKYLDHDSRLMLEQAKRDLLNCIEKCKGRIN